MHCPTEKLSSNNCAAYFRLLFYIPLQHIGCHDPKMCIRDRFNAKYVPVLLEVARERGVPFQATRLETKEEAQNAPTPVTTYALFYNCLLYTSGLVSKRFFL